jgi:ATPase subunit of ABC transporter with duplicated ATPase domains
MKLKDIDTSRSGKRVLEAFNINKSFGDLELLNDAHIDLIYRDRLAILGNNGSGKTTLVRMLLEDASLEESIYKWGSKLNVGYLAQEILFEDDSISVLDYFMNEHTVNQGIARRELAKALFIRDDVLKKINVLSGGEKSKLKLCSLTYNKTNLLILDEPTNHLDIDSREILEEMLSKFKGTILFISHDRYFIKKIASRIGEIEYKQITYYEGDYDYFRYMKSKEKEEPKPKKSKNTKKPLKKEQKDQFKELELLEEKINIIDNELSTYSSDSIKTKKLLKEKEELELQFNKIFKSIED